MTLTYTTLYSSLQNLLQEDSAANDVDFANILPQLIDDAEQRIYREIPFLAQRQENTSVTATSGTRTISLSSTTLPCMVVEQVSLFTTAGSNANNGTRVIFQGPTSIDWINSYWPTASSTSAPGTVQGYWAMVDNQTIALAPTPDASYVVGVTGVFRPAPMTASNATTYLGTYYPDLFFAACMVFGSAYQRDFSAANPADNAMAVTWNTHYETLKQSALDEEARRRGESIGWTPMKQFEGQPPRT